MPRRAPSAHRATYIQPKSAFTRLTWRGARTALGFGIALVFVTVTAIVAVTSRS